MKLIYIANIRVPTEKGHGFQTMKMCEAFSSLRINTDTGQIFTDTENYLQKSDQNPRESNLGELLYEDLTYKIRGAVFNVYNVLGFGHKESVYQNALDHELRKSGIDFESQKSVDLFYDGGKVGIYRPDFIVDNKIIIELKSSCFLTKSDKEQVLHYLKGSRHKLALLINFGASKLQIERLINTEIGRISTDSGRIYTDLNQRESILNQRESVSNLRKSEKINVEMWAPKRFNAIKESPFDYYGIRPVFKIEKISVIDLIPLEKIFGRFANFIESLSFALFVLFRLGGEKADIIYSRDQFICWFLGFTSRKFVYEIHSFPKNIWIYKRIWYKAHKIVAITGGLKALLVSRGVKPEKILVASDAVDLAASDAVLQTKEELKIELELPSDFLVGYVGRFKTLGMEKGIKTMIEALSLLDKETKMVFIGGDEDEIKDYKSLANRFNVVSQCIFVEYQLRVKAIKYRKAMDVLVIPFPNKPHYAFYASPLKLFEYMASGRPIIASDLPALHEILNDKNALFFKPDDAGDLARVIKMLASSQTLGYHLSRQALADVKEYTWDKRAKKILEFIK